MEQQDDLQKLTEELETKIAECTQQLEDVNKNLRKEIAKRKRVENRLQSQETLFRQFVENTPAAVAMFDRNMRYMLASKRWLIDYRLGDRNIIGLSHYEVFPEIPQYWKDIHKRVLAGAVDRSEDHKFLRKDGTVDWLRWEVRPWYDADGEVGGLIMFTEVITRRKQIQELSNALNVINAEISSTRDFDEMMRRVVVESSEAIGCDSACILTHENDYWRVKYIHKLSDEILGTCVSSEDIPYGMQAIETNRPIIINDVYKEVKPVPNFLKLLEICSVLYVPLSIRGEPIGLLAFFQQNRPVSFTDVQVDFAYKLSASVSLALENIRLFEAEREATAREILAREEAERRAEEAEEGRSILEAMMKYIPEGIIVVDSDDMQIRMASEAANRSILPPHQKLQGKRAVWSEFDWQLMCKDGVTPAPIGELPLTRAIQRGEVSTNDEFVIRWADGRMLPILTSAGPIRDQSGDITGAVLAFRDITLIKEARESLEEAYKYERHMAQLLQRALLPKEPFIGNGYDVTAKYISAYAGEEIGGDFYDVFETADHHIGLLIGDIAGKGIEAASLAAATRSTVRAFAYEFSSAGEALTHANTVLFAQQPQSGSFVTVFLAILDIVSGEIVYANAGHPPPLIFHNTGDVELLHYGQPPIGILEQQEFKESVSQIYLGEKIVIYTDGLIEARRDSEVFDLKGVESVLKEHGQQNVNEILSELLNAVNDWARGKQTDDMAVMVIGRR